MAHRAGSSRRDSVVNSLGEITKQKEKISQAENDKQRNKAEKDKDNTSGQFEKEFSKFKSEFKDLFKEFDDRIDKKISKLDEKFTHVFDELRKEIRSVRMEVNDTKEEVKEVKSKVNELESSINYQAEQHDEFVDLQNTKFSRINSEFDEMQKQILILERQERKYNLLFYGFNEQSEENLVVTMRSFFKEKLNISGERVDKMQFTNCHRTPYEGNGPKPIIIRFQSFSDRDLVYSKFLSPVLREEKKRILTDLPIEMKRKRAMLAREAYNIRKNEGMKTRIMEKGLSVFLEVRRSADDSWKRRDIH